MDRPDARELAPIEDAVGFEGVSFRYDGKEMRIDKDEVLGTKDRSWGQRGVGGPDPRGAPAAGGGDGGLLFLWAPLHFDEVGVAFQLFEDLLLQLLAVSYDELAFHVHHEYVVDLLDLETHWPSEG